MPEELSLVKTAIVLGSGLTNFIEVFDNMFALPYAKIDGWYTPSKKIKGHSDRLILAEFKGKWFLIM